MSYVENAAARADVRLHAYALWDRRNCQRCLKSGACELEDGIMFDLYDGLISRAWELPLAQVDCTEKIEKASQDYEP